MARWLRDLRFGFRVLARNKGFALVVVLVLALGVGPNVAMFSVIWAVFLAPNPTPQANQCVVVWNKLKGEKYPTRAGDFLVYRSQSHSFQHLDFAAWNALHLTNPDHSQSEISGEAITPEFFSKNMREPFAMGRDFLPAEGTAGHDHVVILTHKLWQQRFHADPHILGQQIPIEDQPYTVVGIRKQGWPDKGDTQFWVPIAITPGSSDRHVGNVLGRLKPDATLAQAQAELALIDRQLSASRPEGNAWTISVEEMSGDWFDKKVARDLWLLLAAVGFVLLIACANVANLLLARSAGRRREIAIRSAMGASPRQVFTQVLLESLTLAISGGLFGIVLGWVVLKIVVALVPHWMASMSGEMNLNVPVLLFAAAITMLGALLAGCAPACYAVRLNLSDTLKQGARVVSGHGRLRTQSFLVGGEFTLALTLLAGAGLAVHSFWNLTRIDLGVRTDHLLIAQIHLPRNSFADMAHAVANSRLLLEKVNSLPGVLDSALATNSPLQGHDAFPFSIIGQPVDAANRPLADVEFVTPGYFSTFGVHLLRGRFLRDTDRQDTPPVVIISQSFVEHYLAGRDPLSQRLLLAPVVGPHKLGTPTERQIVGVFAGIRNGNTLTDTTVPQVFVSWWQNPLPPVGITVHTVLDPALMEKSLRDTVAQVLPGYSVAHVETMQERISSTLVNDRFGMMLFAGFAALALLLAALGIYSVMSFTVAQRTHEIGLRMALGAQKSDVVALMVGDGMRIAFLGTVLGVAGAIVLGRVMHATLYGVSSVDYVSIVLVAALLLAAALLASWIPARRSARVDPMVALRGD